MLAGCTSEVVPELRILVLVGLVLEHDQSAGAVSAEGAGDAQQGEQQERGQPLHCGCNGVVFWCN